MSKILKKYTTIPRKLYIERTADKQLKSIIEEMERPGYVLVARQMGKTNLLFNAKRELENEERLFVYVDLSNSFEEERDCYQNIIDLIIDVNEGYLSQISVKIMSLRKLKLPSHKEYLKSLRIILDSINGDLIIILDEIDALRNSDYSDHIFAQIRSNYFARTNFPELSRLTYVLSGVIEPSDLIKDKNKSPFNIGEKIYLDDFSYTEHLNFISKSKLPLPERIIKEIYSWTNGNPRLTFDICSDIEDKINDNIKFERSQLEDLIVKKYLTSYDIAPIDHIRELVSKNPEVRSAILRLQYGDSDVSDEIKKKLYLFGIINSNFNNDNLKIKNPIVEKSLSVEWINSIELQSKSLFEIGLQYITSGIQYVEGIALLKEYLDIDISRTEREYTLYYIGYAYHKLREFDKSNRYLTKQIVAVDTSADMHYRQKCFIGINYSNLNQFDESKAILEEVVENYKKGHPYATALLNLVVLLLENSFEKYHTECAVLLDRLIDCIDSLELDSNDVDRKEFKTLSYYYQFRINTFINKIDNALKDISSAIETAEDVYLPELFYCKLVLSNDNSLCEKIVKAIINCNLDFNDIRRTPLCFVETNNYKYLLIIYERNYFDLFNELLQYTLYELNQNTISKNQFLFQLGSIANNTKTANSLLRLIIDKKEKIDDDKLLLNTYRTLSINAVNEGETYEEYFEGYKNLIGKSTNKIELTDIKAFSSAVTYYLNLNKLDTALYLCELIENKFDELSKDLRYESLIIYYLFSLIYFDKKEKNNAIKYADITLNIIENSKKKKTSSIDEKGISAIVNHLERIKQLSFKTDPIKVKRKYKRNQKVTVKYKDGAMVKDIKYKKIEDDVKNNECLIVEDILS